MPIVVCTTLSISTRGDTSASTSESIPTMLFTSITVQIYKENVDDASLSSDLSH